MSEEQSPADRLEKALRDLEARKKAASEAATERAPEAERMKALHEELDALPHHERRAVLDSLGLKNISAALPPITPLRGGGYAGPPQRQAARWQVWSLMPTVPLWQAVVLSLNLEPTESIRNEAMRSQPEASHFRRLPLDYFDRMMVCKSKLSTDGPLHPQGALHRGMLTDPECPVSLVEFAVVVSAAGFEIPEGMRALIPAVREAEASATNWNVWADRQQVEVWEAVALSLDFEPSKTPGLNWENARWKEDVFAGCSDEFRSRLTLACDGVVSGTLPAAAFGSPVRKSAIALAEFASWTQALRNPWKIPSELDGLRRVVAGSDRTRVELGAEAQPTWEDVSIPYIAGIQRKGRHATAKALFNDLEQQVGSPDSPFSKGEGRHRGKLFLDQLNQPLALKTLQNRWAEIQQAAKKI